MTIPDDFETVIELAILQRLAAEAVRQRLAAEQDNRPLDDNDPVTNSGLAY